MKKISEVQAARKAYNALSKKEKDTIKKVQIKVIQNRNID